MKHTKLVCCIMLIAFALLPSMTEAQTKNSTNEAVKAAKMALKKAQVKGEQARKSSGQSEKDVDLRKDIQAQSQFTALFVFGTRDELMKQGILKDGQVLLNKDYSTKIDIRIDKEIKLYSKSAELLTSHPANAYELMPDVNKQYVLKITDPLLFWSKSNYLVIQVGLSKEIQVQDQSEAKTETQELDDNKIYDVCDEMPQFPGGPQALFEYLSKSIKYPVDAENNHIKGRVIVQYVVERDGSISNVIVTKSVYPSLDNEAIRVIQSMPHWIPGKKDGVAVRVKYTTPVTFRLSDKDK